MAAPCARCQMPRLTYAEREALHDAVMAALESNATQLDPVLRAALAKLTRPATQADFRALA